MFSGCTFGSLERVVDLWPEKGAVLVDVREVRTAQTQPLELRQTLVHEATERSRFVLKRAVQRFLLKHLTATSN